MVKFNESSNAFEIFDDLDTLIMKIDKEVIVKLRVLHKLSLSCSLDQILDLALQDKLVTSASSAIDKCNAIDKLEEYINENDTHKLLRD